MLTIRMHRVGKTNQSSFKIVVVDKRKSAAAGRFIEEIGTINRAQKSISLNGERAAYWIKQGAKPSASIHNLLVDKKIVSGKKIAKHGQPKKKEEKGTSPVAAAPAAAAPAA